MLTQKVSRRERKESRDLSSRETMTPEGIFRFFTFFVDKDSVFRVAVAYHCGGIRA
jgi:hypothetical protein